MNTLPKQHRETWLPASRRRRRRGLLLVLIIAIALVTTAIFAIVYLQHSLLNRSETPAFGVEQGGEPQDFSGGSELSVFDGDNPMVGNLDPELRQALEAAANDAAGSGVHFEVNSGWRTVEEQERLFAEAVEQYGSEREAARWVAPPTSMHVQGKAVDIGPMTATDWLAQFGSDYGLCQTYSNELWHYEFVAEAIDNGCPVAYADASEDPRLY
ncbi:M15 family metallopeptidase [Leucobacter sp. UT-8R-CII-1-4]|uniref:M15 family metallopeptidase n=1 Tax=Leucobacter sp. UT-8R-CII-1-4 TaxID=3040075 RepID=UPI0024A82320|nr:M15 family metallopeptidase [Leucobacter sp. UT-8R-CII-1-4]MDI6022713.1 M15 family metallopeptidase [Leucobacter sp. UT-8R-CII-1-4]